MVRLGTLNSTGGASSQSGSEERRPKHRDPRGVRVR